MMLIIIFMEKKILELLHKIENEGMKLKSLSVILLQYLHSNT